MRKSPRIHGFSLAEAMMELIKRSGYNEIDYAQTWCIPSATDPT